MSMSFKYIPANLRTPGYFAELDASQANTDAQNQRTLIIGQVTGSATLTPNVPQINTSVTEARVAGGAGSILAAMVAAYRANDPFGEVWYLPVADAAGGSAATGSVTFSGPASAAGTLSLYIAGQLVAVPVAAAMTAAQLASATVAAIAAAIDLPVSAAVDGTNSAKVDLTAKHKGLCGNDIDLRLNYLGSAGGESLAPGLTVTFVGMSGGATNPTLTAALSALGDMPFDVIVSPFTDSASVQAISTFLGDQAGRWSWDEQIYGHCFIATRGTQGTLAVFGATLNDQHLSAMGFNDSPSPNYVWAAGYAGAYAVSMRADPARPAQNLAIAGVLAPPIQSRFLRAQRNALLFDGISTFTVDPSGAVLTENIITTYQTNAQGQPDDAYLEIETMFGLMYVLRYFASVNATKFANAKLGADGVRYPAGSGVVTPSTIKAEQIAIYGDLQDQGQVQRADFFNANVSVTPNAQNPDRVDLLLPIVLIGKLRVMANLVQFRLN